ncbi:hypothetical protein [Streptomyces sp. NPDC059134]
MAGRPTTELPTGSKASAAHEDASDPQVLTFSQRLREAAAWRQR